MKLSDFIRPEIQRMQAYVPGAQKNEAEILKLNSNENPFPPSEAVRRALHEAVDAEPLQKYPDPGASRLRRAIARQYGCKENQVLIGNGSDEILSLLFRAFFEKGDRLIIPDPTYSLYPVLAEMFSVELKTVPLQEDWHIDFLALLSESKGAKLVILAQPNAPTGILEEPKEVAYFIKECKCPVLIDGAYADFASSNWVSSVGQDGFSNLMVCGTFSKSYSLAGLRVGWLAASEDAIFEIDKIRDSYNVNRLGQAAALAAIEDRRVFERRISEIVKNRSYLKAGLEELGFFVLESSANFLMLQPRRDGRASSELAGSCYNFLKQKDILIRYFPTKRLASWLRISIGTREDMHRLLLALKEWKESLDSEAE